MRIFKNRVAGAVGLGLAVFAGLASASELSVRLGQAPGQATVEASGIGQGRVGALMFSGDLANWFPVAATAETALGFREPAGSRQRFYQLLETTPPKLSASPNWKTKLSLPSDQFLVEFKAADGGAWVPPGTKKPKETQWVKFAVLMDDLTTVYFQDGNRLKFHYDFGTRHVPEFDGMTHMAFDGATLYHAGRRAVVGAVLFSEKNSEYAIQLVGQDRFPAPMVAFLWQLVDGAIDKPEILRGLYMPTFEQADISGAVADALAQNDVPVVSAQPWETGSDAIYSHGWAMGRLVFVEGGNITAAFRAGELTSADILLTDHVPAEVPRVAGIVALNPSTPNSHVAILAKNFGVPFYYEGNEATRAGLLGLAGRDVMIRTSEGWGINSSGATATLSALEAELPDGFRAAIAQLKAPPKLTFAAKAEAGAYTLPMKSIKPSDTKLVGGKAAKFSLLRKLIPKNSPDPALAITFDLWDEFMTQRLANGKSLRGEIDSRLAKAHESGLPADLADALKGIRKLIRSGEFVESQRQALIAALSPFDQTKKIRFRSSTNMEDSRHFTGAGLYDSYSGCLLDDLDDDTAGPCACDDTKQKERGVFRAIRRVYASFYNDNAYLERRRFSVDEADSGMAILVHHSFPDENELANGVAVSTFNNYTGNSFNMWSNLSTQVGATSVANPDTTAVPELVSVSGYRSSNGSTSRRATFESRSSLLQVGRDHVMKWKNDYESLHQLLEKVAVGFSRYAVDREQYTLDFEYKKIEPGKLIVKQVREVPQPQELKTPIPVLAGGRTMLRLYQGEHGGSVFARHRLKSIWNIRATSRVLNSAGKKTSVVDSASWTRVIGGKPVVVKNGIKEWDNHRYSTGTQNNVVYLVDQWEETLGGETVTYKLSAGIPRWMPDRSSPILFAGELDWRLEANYKKSRTDYQRQAFGGSGLKKKNVRADQIELQGFDPAAGVGPDDLLQERLAKGKGGKKIEIKFYWPPPPTGPSAGYTAPLKAWKETVITGLTEEPIVMDGWYSQTYAPGHHNFWEEFIFEPSKEEGISQAQLEALEEADVKLIYLFIDRGRSADAYIIGYDDEARAF
ncbi:MAG: hypothetical protein H8E20_11390 [Verrucomicrobia bacterium]|nr:hypothetical protein [Verrucomicrobiota bacterium]